MTYKSTFIVNDVDIIICTIIVLEFKNSFLKYHLAFSNKTLNDFLDTLYTLGIQEYRTI